MVRLLIYVGDNPTERYALCAECSRKATGFDAVARPAEIGQTAKCEGCGKEGRIYEAVEAR